jgi:hypothetical protein
METASSDLADWPEGFLTLAMLRRHIAGSKPVTFRANLVSEISDLQLPILEHLDHGSGTDASICQNRLRHIRDRTFGNVAHKHTGHDPFQPCRLVG